MNALITWFLLANTAFAAIYLFFWLFLHRDTFFKAKRWALLMGMLFAMVYPLINYGLLVQESPRLSGIAQTLSYNLPEVTITAESAVMSTIDMFIAGYLLISC